MPRIFRLLAVWTLMAVVTGPGARGTRGAEIGPAASETALPPLPNTAAVYQAPAASPAPNGYVQPTAYVAGALPQSAAAPSSAASVPAKKSTPLPPPSRRIDPGQSHASGESAASRPGALPSLATLAGSLLVVIGLFLAAAWFLRRTTGGHVPTLPKEVVDVLGRAPLSGRQQVHLLRVGRKLILVSVSQSGMETLTEITESVEVDRLAGLCQQARPDSATTVFRNVLEQVGVQSGSRRRARQATADELRLADLEAPQSADEYRESRHG